MIKEISGFVENNPLVLDNCCMFLVRKEDDFYLVISRGEQSAKDNIFVAKGDRIHVKGGVFENECLKGILISQQSKIINLEKHI